MTKPKGPTAKSARTREAIENAARELFSSAGFEQTTVRDIAARAAIDPSMVIRYFGSKEALFARVAQPDLHMPQLDSTPPGQVGETLVSHFLDQWEGDGGRGGLAVLLRSATQNEEAAERLRDMFAAQVMPAIARAGGGGTAPQRAGLVASQLLGLALTRYILKLTPVVKMPREVIVREVGATIQRYAAGETAKR